MTAPFGVGRRADQLAAAIDSPHRDVDAELRALVDVVGALRTAVADDPRAMPRDEFAADLRVRLMAEADDVLVPGSPLVLRSRPTGRRERRLVAAAAAVVLIGGSAGMAAASQGALPGDTLYPVKRGIERAEAGLSVSSAGKGRDLLHQADARLAEVSGLLDSGRLDSEPRVPAALEDFVAQAEQGSTLLMGSFQETRDPATVRTVREFTAGAVADLEAIADTAPASLQGDLGDAALALRDIDVRADRLCAACAADLPSLQLPGVFLAAAEVDRALTDLDADVLDNSHPFVVPRTLVPGGLPAGDRDRDSGGADGLVDPDTTGDTGGVLPSSPNDPAPSLPGDGATGSGTKKLKDTVNDVGETVGDTAGDITDGLTGVVETVLPDPVTGLTDGLGGTSGSGGSGSGGLLP